MRDISLAPAGKNRYLSVALLIFIEAGHLMSIHLPVMPAECIDLLALKAGDTVVDGTLGGGGHTRLLAEVVGPQGRVIAMDRDAAAIAAAEASLTDLPVTVLHANYANLPEALEMLEIQQVDGILCDLGLSSDQLEDRDRGFSFNSDGLLDLRFDVERGEPAWKLIARLSPEHLADLIYQYGEERLSRRIARAIDRRKAERPVETASDLAAIVRRAVPGNYDARIDPATRTFQALRIAVNEELRWLNSALQRFPDCLRTGGRMAMMSFHSLEDRPIKQAFREDSRLEVLTAKPVMASDEEVASNPRSRSAKLRVAKRV